ncbi:MAG: formylglycine-generating enzyme family protein, partial [Rhodothermaceae bacterium]|nr:formylglycine-generating enzyme family protein [Rhodothermaceae bacterium]
VAPFFMDVSPVTVARFRAFVEATGYTTEAERFGNAGVMAYGAWHLAEGATWHHPLGPASSPAPADHPVTQVSWNDAVAFCEAEGKRLPTEVEWEHAARGARDDRHPYAWGDSLATHDHEGTHHHANTWNGTFPIRNTGDDGYFTTSPVGTFGATPLGLTDIGGNVWEWTDDWYRSYADRDQPFTPTPESEKALRGGSFLCHTSYCHGYRVSARSHATPETSLFHTGFRCVQELLESDR